MLFYYSLDYQEHFYTVRFYTFTGVFKLTDVVVAADSVVTTVVIVAGDSVRLRTDSDSAADHGSSIYGLADGGRLQTRLVQPLYR